MSAASWARDVVTRSADWLREQLGPHPDVVTALAHQRAELGAAQRRLAEQAARHRSAEAQMRRHVELAQAHERGAQRALYAAYEPPEGEGCGKVRLRDEQEATGYARFVERSAGLPADSLHGYPCRGRAGRPECPRQPLSGDRFWHIANVDAALRTGRPAAIAARSARHADAARSGRLIGQRVDRPVPAPPPGPRPQQESGPGPPPGP